MRPGLDLDQRHHSGDLDRADDTWKSIPRGEVIAGPMAARGLAQAFDLLPQHSPAVALVPRRLDPPGAVPAPDRVGTHAELRRGPPDRQAGLLLRHCLGSYPGRRPP